MESKDWDRNSKISRRTGMFFRSGVNKGVNNKLNRTLDINDVNPI